MTTSASEVLETALQLPARDRAGVVLGLLESLHDSEASNSDSELVAEADRREAMMDADSSMEISHEELLAGLQRNRKQ